jgi:hypothetical protein
MFIAYTFKVAVGMSEPPEPPKTISRRPSLSIIAGVIDDNGLFLGAM